MRLFDTHSHLAWGIDDGYKTKEDSINALKMMQQQGVKYVVSTPHFIPGSITKDKFIKMNERIDELTVLASEYDVNIIRGCELFLNHEFMDTLDERLINTIGHSDYLLAEFNVTRELGKSDQVEDRLYELSVRGYTVLIAHVERYFQKKLDMNRIKDWINQGYYIQVNTSSLLGIHGPQVQKNAFMLIDEGCAHIIGTDTHSSTGRRNPNLSKAYSLIEERYGKEKAIILFYKNGLHILNNEDMEYIEPIKPSFFKKIFGKG